MKKFHIKSQFLLKKDTAWHHEPCFLLAAAGELSSGATVLDDWRAGGFHVPLATWPSLPILVASVLLQASLEFRSPEVSL